METDLAVTKPEIPKSRFMRAVQGFASEEITGPRGGRYIIYTEGGEDGDIGIMEFNGNRALPAWILKKYIPADYRSVLTGGTTYAWHGQLFSKMEAEKTGPEFLKTQELVRVRENERIKEWCIHDMERWPIINRQWFLSPVAGNFSPGCSPFPPRAWGIQCPHCQRGLCGFVVDRVSNSPEDTVVWF